jgi:hypothetical protein
MATEGLNLFRAKIAPLASSQIGQQQAIFTDTDQPVYFVSQEPCYFADLTFPSLPQHHRYPGCI